jgi:hypothetical protein
VAYVWQQSEVVRLAYVGQAKSTAFQDLLDKNSQLRYSLKQNTSLIHLASKVTDKSDFQMPNNYYLVKLTSPQERAISENNRVSRTLRLVYRLFGVQREAEAKTLNR